MSRRLFLRANVVQISARKKALRRTAMYVNEIIKVGVTEGKVNTKVDHKN